MRFVSEAQRGYMWARHPEIARRFQAETPAGKLPEHVGERRKHGGTANGKLARMLAAGAKR